LFLNNFALLLPLLYSLCYKTDELIFSSSALFFLNRLPTHHYVYHTPAASSYITAGPSLILPSPAASLTPTHFFDYTQATFPPPFSNGLDSTSAAFAQFNSHPGSTLGPSATMVATASTSPNTISTVNQVTVTNGPPLPYNFALSGGAGPNVGSTSAFLSPAAMTTVVSSNGAFSPTRVEARIS